MALRATRQELPFTGDRESDRSQPYVTELDLRLAQLPGGSIEYLREVMPSHANEAEELEYDYERWLDDVFV